MNPAKEFGEYSPYRSRDDLMSRLSFELRAKGGTGKDEVRGGTETVEDDPEIELWELVSDEEGVEVGVVVGVVGVVVVVITWWAAACAGGTKGRSGLRVGSLSFGDVVVMEELREVFGVVGDARCLCGLTPELMNKFEEEGGVEESIIEGCGGVPGAECVAELVNGFV